MKLVIWSPLKEHTICTQPQTYVTGIGSTTKDPQGYTDIVNVGSSTTLSVVPVITVQDAASLIHWLNTDGVYTTFDFTKDPDTISDEFMIEKKRVRMFPQTISIQGFSEKGKGCRD